ncbi:Dabb family protein [Oceanobacillus rekensis]|uniref:Dabb family protein n=1 Tax=Oceanobacillus rekensis TaxID=937927 RepID=UPI000B43900C|nr:Dabb family protein [Oceanobacillus rekensis]
MIEHIVLVKFSTQTSKEEKDELIRRTLALKELIPGILDIQQGHNFSTRSKGYNVGLTVRFENEAALENYGPHPEHQKVFSYLQSIGMEDSIVVDFQI